MPTPVDSAAWIRQMLGYSPIAFYQLGDKPFGATMANGDVGTDEVGDWDGVYLVHNDPPRSAEIIQRDSANWCCNPWSPSIEFFGSVDFVAGVPSGGAPNGCLSIPGFPDLTGGDFTVIGTFEVAYSVTTTGGSGVQGARGVDITYEKPGGGTGVALSTLSAGIVGNLNGAEGNWQGWAFWVIGGFVDRDSGLPVQENTLSLCFQVGDAQLIITKPKTTKPRWCTDNPNPAIHQIVVQRMGDQLRAAWDVDAFAHVELSEGENIWDNDDYDPVDITGPEPDGAGPGLFIGTANFNRALSGYWGNQHGVGVMQDWMLFSRALSDDEIVEILRDCGRPRPLDISVWSRFRGTVETPEPALPRGGHGFNFAGSLGQGGDQK